MRPRLPRQRAGDIGRVGDDGVLAAPFQELDDGLNLGSHAALGKVRAFGQVGFGLGQRHPVEPTLLRLAEVNGDLLDGRADDERVRAQPGGQQRGGCLLYTSDAADE